MNSDVVGAGARVVVSESPAANAVLRGFSEFHIFSPAGEPPGTAFYKAARCFYRAACFL
jgi:hypothetical protein